MLIYGILVILTGPDLGICLNPGDLQNKIEGALSWGC